MNDQNPFEEDYYQRYYPKRRFRFLSKLNSRNPKLNVILFIATCGTTFATGWFQNGTWQAGAWYSSAIISILLAHEMGHYVMCRKYGIRATLPFFIPFIPFINPFGTMGAVIRMESIIPSRKALFDVAVAGPLAGLAITIPCLYFGIQFSEIVSLTDTPNPGTIFLGESFLYRQISQWAIGTLPENQDLLLHPLAFAGWAGLFVTALNLLPIGQLDGGHIVYAMLGKLHKFVAIVALSSFALVCLLWYRGWVLLLLLIIWFGYRHPPTVDESPIDARRIFIGILTLIIFVLSFTPEPFKF
jgi:membrane-associated protease RseP (regulator of RpoE activity)